MKRLLSIASFFALALTVLPARAATAPAITAFDDAFASVNDYTVTVRAHEVKGSQSQDRVYHYWFKRPNMAKIQIASGDGAGNWATWRGGDTISGHKSGLIAFIHMTLSVHDPQATSLRGATIPDGLLQNEVDRYREMKGDLSQKAGPVFNGVPTDQVELRPADPSSYGGVTRMIIYLSRNTHFPVRQLRYEGSQIVADISFTELKLNVGLKDSDF